MRRHSESVLECTGRHRGLQWPDDRCESLRGDAWHLHIVVCAVEYSAGAVLSWLCRGEGLAHRLQESQEFVEERSMLEHRVLLQETQ